MTKKGLNPLKATVLLIGILILSVSCSETNHSNKKNNNFIDQFAKDSIVGTYIDTTLGGLSIRIEYLSDSAILVKCNKGSIIYDLRIEKYMLPSWFDPSKFEVEYPGLFTIDKKGEIKIFAKIGVLDEEIIYFPIFDNKGLFNLIFLEINKDKELTLLKNNYPVLLRYLTDKTFFSIFIDMEKKLLATSEFYEHQPSIDEYEVYKFDNDTIFKKTHKIVEKGQCPFDIAKNNQEIRDRLFCLSKILF